MFEACVALAAEMHELEGKLADPSTHSDPNAARKLGKRHAELRPLVAAYEQAEHRHAAKEVRA